MQVIKDLGLQPYTATWQAMQAFTDQRDATTPDEVWLVEHEPVFTQGRAGKPEHILDAHGIPIVHSDRGGQVTYHGPGQLLVYCLFDIDRQKISVRQLVCGLEQIIIDTLEQYGVTAARRHKAPGVYVSGKKIASLGLRIRRGCCYHGFSFNYEMDLTPFSYINPCGYAGLQMINFVDLTPAVSLADVKYSLCQRLKTMMSR